MCSGLCNLSFVAARSHGIFSVDLQDDLTVPGSQFRYKNDYIFFKLQHVSILHWLRSFESHTDTIF